MNQIILSNNEASHECPFCKGSNFTIQGNIDYGKNVLFSSVEIRLTHIPYLMKCNSCNSSFTQNRISQTDVINLYSKGNSNIRWQNNGFKESKGNICNLILKAFNKLNPTVLDFGCNSGELLDFMKQYGCETYGIELSKTAREHAQSKGHTVKQTLDELKGTKFDMILCFDVIEHIIYPKEFINSLISCLSDNGKLIFLTGNIESNSSVYCKNNWYYIKYPEHIFFPSKQVFENKNFITKIHNVYNSTGYNKYPYLIKYLYKLLKHRKWNGLPSLYPDHVLIIMEKLPTPP